MSKIEENEVLNSSLGNRVFTLLQEDILNGKYQIGESLIETKLSLDFGVSRTPVREAIKQLELEGLVKFTPNKGAVVKGVSKQDIKDIFTIRMLIEGLAARWAAENITDAELKKLKETYELEEFYTKKADIEQLIKLDTKFHEILYKACKSIPLIHTLSTFHHYLQKARASNMKIPGRSLNTLSEHNNILIAVTNKDADLAEKHAKEHVRKACMNLTEEWEN